MPSRRGILAGMPALGVALAATTVAGSCTTSAGPDDTLLRLCAELDAHQAGTAAMEAPYLNGGMPDAVYAAMVQRTPTYHAIIDKITATPARTLVGLRAKARISFNLTDNLGEPIGGDERISWSLAKDLLALEGAA